MGIKEKFICKMESIREYDNTKIVKRPPRFWGDIGAMTQTEFTVRRG